MIGFANLEGDLQAMISSPYPDFGQTFYMVDSDFRTGLQGWSQADGTGPLDLFKERNPGRVFYTPGAGSPNPSSRTEVQSIQAAIDAMVDFRGDTLLFTPGVYSLPTAINLDVAGARYVGPPSRMMKGSRVIIRGTAAGVVPIVATTVNNEMAFIQLTTSAVALANSYVELTGADYFHFHDSYVNMNNDTSSAVTAIPFEIITTASNGMQFERFWFDTDGDFGPFLDLTAASVGTVIRDFTHVHNVASGSAHAVSIFKGDADLLDGNLIHRGIGICAGVSLVTDLATTSDQTVATTCLTVADFRGSVGYGTNTNLVTATTDATAIDEVECWLATPTGTLPANELNASTPYTSS